VSSSPLSSDLEVHTGSRGRTISRRPPSLRSTVQAHGGRARSSQTSVTIRAGRTARSFPPDHYLPDAGVLRSSSPLLGGPNLIRCSRVQRQIARLSDPYLLRSLVVLPACGSVDLQPMRISMARTVSIKSNQIECDTILTKALQSGHINFLLGSGASLPAIATAGDIESTLNHSSWRSPTQKVSRKKGTSFWSSFRRLPMR
jgi:hypothetical protein